MITPRPLTVHSAQQSIPTESTANRTGRLNDKLSTVGTDAEPHAPLPDGVLPSITLVEERHHLRDLETQRPGIYWDRLLFSIRESVFKAWYPLTGRWLDFTEATVRISPQRETFHAWLLVPGPVVDGVEVGGFAGRWLVDRDLVVTRIAVPAANPPTSPDGPGPVSTT